MWSKIVYFAVGKTQSLTTKVILIIKLKINKLCHQKFLLR